MTEEVSQEPNHRAERSYTIAVVMLFSCVIVLFVIILLLVGIIVQEQKKGHFRFQGDNYHIYEAKNVTEFNTNRMYTGFEDVDFVCISLEHRVATHFDYLQSKLDKEQVKLTLFKGINGKSLNLNDYVMTPQYKAFFVNNQRELKEGKTKTNWIGHLGCTLSHMEVLANVQKMTVILEDDADPQPRFRERFQAAVSSLGKLDPQWELLLIGFCASYNDYHYHKLNDREPVYEGGIARIQAWIGNWGYVVRNRSVAQKILSFNSPLSWHIDLKISEGSREGKLRAYGCIPPLVFHAGSLRISSFDLTTVGDFSRIKSDTNL